MKFHIDDRIVVHDIDRTTGKYTKDKGIVIIAEESRLLVKTDNWKNDTLQGSWFASKQCRRLIKKERQKVWLHCTVDGKVSLLHSNGRPCAYCKEFIEVKNK